MQYCILVPQYESYEMPHLRVIIMGLRAERSTIKNNLLKSRPTNDQKQNKATLLRHQKVSDTWYEQVLMQSNCCLYSPRNLSQDARTGS